MSNIEKIRQEIERLKGVCMVQIKANSGQAFPFVMEMTGYDKLLAFIDSLPEENHSEDLEEAADEYASDGSIGFIDMTAYNAFIAGAEWQKEQMPIPEDTVLFQKGVKEGRRLEKDDLALTWEDMAKIDAIILDVNNEFAVDHSKEIDRRKFYGEVLKRFKEVQK